MPVLQTNDRVGDFEIIRLLGKGGMGEVYEARQLNPDRRVAVKVLAKWLADDEEALARFMREAEVPANLDHPNIVKIISTGKTPIAHYAMHLVRGISLAQLIERGNAANRSDAPTKSLDAANTPSMEPPATDDNAPPSPAPGGETSPQLLADYRSERFTALARIGAQAARALAWAHQQNHLHRDIKPSNLMVDHHNQVYLVDFGLTRGLEPGGSSTQPGVIVGTPWYMSPEQADSQPLDGRTDIYSLGVTLYELATQGLGPFTANRDDRRSVLVQVRAGQTLPLRTLAQGIPQELERIILKAMHLRPNKRYANAGELANDLEAFLGIASKHTPHPVKKPSIGTRWRWPIGIGGAAVLGAVVIALVLAAVNPNRDPLGPVGDDKGDRPDVVENSKWDGSRALPESLRGQPFHVANALMNDNMEPVWKERFYGSGGLSPAPELGKLEFLSPRNDYVSIFGIADPDRKHFRVSIQLYRVLPNDSERNRVGVVFGWQRRPANSNLHPRFFVVDLESKKKGPDGFGFLKIGTARLIQPTKDRGTVGNDWYRQLPGESAAIPLQASNLAHTIVIEVHNENASVAVDKWKPINVSLAKLREQDPATARDLRIRGAVGIWAANGLGIFKGAQITLLPDD